MEIDIQDTLERNKEILARQIEEITKEQLQQALEEQANEAIADVIENFITKEIKPILKKQLVEMKAQILSGIVGYLEQIVSMLGNKMLKSAKENLANSYDFREIMKRLFD